MPVETRKTQPHPLQNLPRVDRFEERRAARDARSNAELLIRNALEPVMASINLEIELGLAERQDRAAGLARAGVIAHFSWPRFDTRLAIGIETPLAHAIVDRLLGFWRFPGQDRLQVSPVEWGLIAYTTARGLTQLAKQPGPLGAWDLILDRVSPEPFDPRGLGPLVTIRWPVQIGETTGSARLWIPEALLDRVQHTEVPAMLVDLNHFSDQFGDLTSDWVAEIGTVQLARGFRSLRIGGVLPLSGCNLSGKPSSPSGGLELVSRSVGTIFRIPAAPISNTAASRVTLRPPRRSQPQVREPIVMSATSDASNATAKPADLPVTLAVELGRISLPISRLADLREGDVIELGRHPQEPVELTSGGRLVARGELVQIDTELGVRLTSIFL